MTTPNDYAKFAAQCDQLAAAMKPPDGDPYAMLRKEIQYHLVSALSKAKRISEDIAQKGAS